MLKAIADDKYRFPGIYRGRVEDKEDPLGRGRVKVRVYPMMDGIKKEDLPWAEPCWTGFLKVPQVGNWVWVMFIDGDITSPVWLGWSVPFSEKGLKCEGEEQYEEFDIIEFIGKELFDESGAEYPEAVVLRHRSGSRLVFYNSGKIWLKNKVNAMIILDANGRITIKNQNGARIILFENGNIEMVGNRIDLNPLVGNAKIGKAWRLVYRSWMLAN
jgi:hypothetical protein